jgi:dihydrofolate reductase
MLLRHPLRKGERGAALAAVVQDLVDGLHLFVYPLTRGEGPRLFPPDAAPIKLDLERSETYDNGVVYQAYRPQT